MRLARKRSRPPFVDRRFDAGGLSGHLALAAHGGDGPAAPDLVGRAVDVSESGRAALRYDFGAGSGGDACRGSEEACRREHEFASRRRRAPRCW